jgi:D-alanyl-D-alanine endopeptidase (penicillin-binding protein 7)
MNAFAFGLALFTSAPAEATLLAAEEVPSVWAPPDWFPEQTRPDLLAIEQMQGQAVRSSPEFFSRSIFVYDLDRGEVLISRRADDLRPVASLTKVISGLSLASLEPDLERPLCTDLASKPAWPGSVRVLRPWICTTGWDLVGAALVRSDNGAALSFPLIGGETEAGFAEIMNEVAASLAMDQSSFVEPSGADDENLSTARDMSRAIVAASAHPMLQPAFGTSYWDVSEFGLGTVHRLRTTIGFPQGTGAELQAAKTGYTDTAGFCFTSVLRTAQGRRLALTTLGAPNSWARWEDVKRALAWADGRKVGRLPKF